MPYEIKDETPEITAKMERCVANVMQQGNSKSQAIGICKSSLGFNEELKDVEIVRAGKFNGKRISKKLLEIWLEDFQKNKKSGYLPTIHIGHNLEEDDTKQAEGLITNLYLKGSRLFADIRGLASDFIETIRKYPYRSIEATADRLRSVALLGAVPPAVKNEPVLLSESFTININNMNDDDKKDEIVLEEDEKQENQTPASNENDESNETPQNDGEQSDETESEDESEDESVQLSETVKLAEELKKENLKLAEEIEALHKEKIEAEVSEKVSEFVLSEENPQGVLKDGDKAKKLALKMSVEDREEFFAVLSEVVDKSLLSEPKGKTLAEGEDLQKALFSEARKIKAEKGIGIDDAMQIAIKKLKEE